MINNKFSGVFTALITPFNSDGSVNFHQFENLLNSQIRSDINGLVVCGTTAESPCLSEEESFKIIEIAVKYSDGRVPVIAGVGSNNTAKTCSNALKAQKLGVDGLLIIAPYYNKPSKEGIVAHFSEIDSKVDIPIIVYNHPGRTGVDVDVNTLEKLSRLKNIIGIKDVSGDASRILDTQKRVGENFVQFSGDDMNILPFYSHGGHGVISVASNIFPKEMVEIYKEYSVGKSIEALKIYKRYFDIFELLGCEINPVPVKYCAELMGICSQDVRLPLVTLQKNNQERINKAMSELVVLK
jgi:4-hydroxy-tetrahydrodipicolinate synthase